MQTSEIPVIKEWRLTYLDGTTKELRENSYNDIIRFARSIISDAVREVTPCYSIVGRIYGGDYPEGHTVVTHTVTKLTNISTSALAKTVADNGEKVLIVKTVRDEEFLLVVRNIDMLV